MKKLVLPLACLLVMAASPAKAQVRVHINLGLPIAPPLVVVQPGIQVVEGFPEEVFFSSGWYWCRRPDGWYRARRPRDRFAPVEYRRVPERLRGTPSGHYRNWHREGPRHQEGPRGHQEMRPQPMPRSHQEGPHGRQEARPHDNRGGEKGHGHGDKDDRGPHGR